MDRQHTFSMILALFMILVMTSALSVQPVKAATLIVPDEFPTVQAAVDYANDGDTILLKAATFESSINIYKSVLLVGEGSPGVFCSITVSASDVQIANLSIFGGIAITTSNNVKVSGNSIFGNIILDHSSGLNLSRNNYVEDITMSSSTGCSIANNNYVGNIWLYDSSNNKIADNYIDGDKFGICVGLNSSNNLFDRNSINIFGSGEGLWVFGSSNVFNNTDLNIFGGGYLECIGPYTWNNSISFSNVFMNTFLGFVLDELSPPSTACSYDNMWHTSDFPIDLNASDEKSGVLDTYYRINNGATLSVSSNGQPTITSEGINNTLEYWSMDNAGNEENHTILTEIKLDKAEPAVGNLFRTPAGDVEPDGEVSIEGNVTDLISGVKDVRLFYHTNDSPSWLDFSMTFNETNGLFEYTIPMQSQDTLVEYKITAFDYAGNEVTEDNEGQYYAYAVIPKFPSILILSPENKTYNVGNILLTFTVDRLVSWIGYGLDGETNVSISGNTTLTDLSEGLYRIVIYANDSTGDMGASNAEYFTIDMTPPVTSNNYDDIWHSADFSITLSATDDISGVKETFYRINGGIIENGSLVGQPTITSEGANNTLEYWSIDNVGNEEQYHFLTNITLDKTPPLIATPLRDPSSDVQPNQLVMISVNVSDSLSGIDSVKLMYFTNRSSIGLEFPIMFNQTSGLYERTILVQEANTLVKYHITAYDRAGNNVTNDNAGEYYIYSVIPEFPFFLALSSFMTATLLVVIVHKRKHRNSPGSTRV